MFADKGKSNAVSSDLHYQRSAMFFRALTRTVTGIATSRCRIDWKGRLSSLLQHQWIMCIATTKCRGNLFQNRCCFEKNSFFSAHACEQSLQQQHQSLQFFVYIYCFACLFVCLFAFFVSVFLQILQNVKHADCAYPFPFAISLISSRTFTFCPDKQKRKNCLAWGRLEYPKEKGGNILDKSLITGTKICTKDQAMRVQDEIAPRWFLKKKMCLQKSYSRLVKWHWFLLQGHCDLRGLNKAKFSMTRKLFKTKTWWSHFGG